MIRTFLLIVTLMPLAATAHAARPVVNTDQLQQSVAASSLLDRDVLSEDGREIGEVEDIVVTRSGELSLYLLDMEDGDDATEFETAAGDEGDWTAKGEEIDPAVADRGGVEWGEGLAPVAPRDLQHDASGDEFVLRSGAREHRSRKEEESRLLRVSDLLGMEVNLADEDSFGSVEDVMLNADRSEVVALVVDNWDGMDKQRRALPMSNAVVMSDDEEVVYPYTLDQVDAIEEFDLDGGWSLD